VTYATPGTYSWPLATATGVVGSPVTLNAGNGGAPGSYSVQVYVTGTVPSVCTFEVQSSPDTVAWDTGVDTPSGDVTCASATVKTYSFNSKPVPYIRVNIGTLTGADGTTQIHFFYTRGRNAQ
jgi:hypothetical protein